jgi:cyclic-di-AMP phosphodiesterase PgpH
VGILVAHIVIQHPGTADDSRALLLLGLTIAITALAAKLTVAGRDVNTYYGYLFPAAAASMLIAVLLNIEIAFVATAAVAVMMGLITSTPFESASLTLIGGAVGLLAVSRLERLTAVFRAGLFVSIANVLVNLGYYLFGAELDPQRMGLLVFVAVVNGLLSAGLALSAIYILGHAFGINTTISLLELAHPSHPLFRKLLTEAPGTYHHSVVLGNLSERAAEVIGADALLCRIGAYYHDIGKTARPYAFIENQVGGENIHDTLDPLTSARIIISHVTDGLELARRYGVPSRVQEMISQHHGTTTAGFFYRQASQNAEVPPDESLFRYPGPKPQSRETGIMMLADATEAAVRANKDHSPAAVDAVVRRIIQERVNSGQLSECDLTLRDLDQIRTTFGAVLQGIFHPRIEYPPAQGPVPSARVERGVEPPKEED